MADHLARRACAEPTEERPLPHLSHPHHRSLRPPRRIVLAAVLFGSVAAMRALPAAGSSPSLRSAASATTRLAPAPGHDFGQPVFSADARGDLVTIGNVTTTCDPDYENDRWTATESRAACEGALAGEVGLTRYDGAPMPPINNRLSMVHVDTDGDRATFASSSADLAMPAGAEVLWAGLHWNAATDVPQADQLFGSTHEIGAPSEADRFLVRLATPSSGGYVELDAAGPDGDTWDDTNPGGTTSYGAFVDVTDLVRAGGAGRYQVADVQSCQGFGGCFGSWSLTVAFADEDEPPRNLNVWHGWQLTSPSVDDGEQTFEVGGITPPPNGVVQARIGVVQADGDRGLGPDSLDISSPSSPAWTTFDTADRPLAPGEDDWFNSTVNAYGVRRGDAAATPNLLANLNQDIALVQDDTVIANADTSFRFRVRTSGTESLYSQVVHAAVELYAPQIGLTKTVEPKGPVSAGDEVMWTLQVRNDGIDPIRHAVVTDPLPEGVTYVPGSIRFVEGGPAALLGTKTDATGDDAADFDAATRTLRFRVGAGATATDGGTMEVAPATDGSHTLTISFRTRVDAAADVTTTNAAHAHGEGRELDDPFGPLETDATDDAPIATVPEADLGIAKTDGDAVVRAVGDRFTYELTARNAGPSPATGVMLTDELDPMVRFVDGDDGCAAAGQLVTCPVGPLAVGAEATRSFVVEVVELPGPGATIPNVAVVDGDQPNPDCAQPTPAAACNEDDEETPQPAVDLGITKTDDDAVVRQVGDTFIYRLTATNAGPDDATGVTIVDELDPRLAFAGSEDCAADGRTVTCTVGDLTAGTSHEVTFEVEVVTLPAPGETIPNVATVHGAEPDPDCTAETPDALCNADDEDTPRPPAPAPGPTTSTPTPTPPTRPTPARTGPASRTGDGWLPLTGAPTAAWAAIGMALLGLGGTAAIAGARTRRAQPQR